MNTVQVRAALVSDVPAIRSIALRTWPVAYKDILAADQLAYMLELMYSGIALHEQFNSLGHRFFLAEDGGQALGFASVSKVSTTGARLHKLYVLPDQQGKRIGETLLHTVRDVMHQDGALTLELNVNRHNPAKDFYLRQGFRIVRDEVIPIGNGYVMDDHVLVCDL